MKHAGVVPRSLVQKWQFGVEIRGFTSAYFNKTNFPEIEFEEVAFSPAGSMFDQKALGRAKFTDITLTRGIPQDNPDFEIMDWIRKCINVYEGTGGMPKDYMVDIDLVKYDRSGKEIKRYRLYDAYCKKATFGEGEGGSSDNDIETMVIGYQYFEQVK